MSMLPAHGEERQEGRRCHLVIVLLALGGFAGCGDSTGPDGSGSADASGRLLFAGDSAGTPGAWSMRADGSDVRRIDGVPGGLLVVSPDGRRVTSQFGRDVWVAGLSEGADPPRIGLTLHYGSVQDWNANSDRLLYLRGGVTFDTGVYSSEPDGSGQTSHSLGFTGTPLEFERVPGSTDQIVILYRRMHEDGSAWDIWFADLRGGGGRLLTTRSEIRELAVSPDGRSIAYQVRPEGRDFYDLVTRVVAIDGTGDHEAFDAADLPVAGSYVGPPRWSPDSGRLAHWVDQNSIWSVALDGSDRRLIAEGGLITRLAWTPDGVVFADVSPPAGRTRASLFLVETDGRSEPVPLIEAPGLRVTELALVP